MSIIEVHHGLAELSRAGTGLASAGSLDQWFDVQNSGRNCLAKLMMALLKVFSQAGVGIFPGPAAVEKETCRQYHVQLVGRLDAVRERFYAISVERKRKHPAVKAITEAAQSTLFQ